MTPKPKRTIAITDTYRLAFPDADNVVIERFVTVNPIKSPAYDPTKHDAAIRTEWRTIGKHFSTIPKALTYLNVYLIHTGKSTTLREVLVEIDSFRTHINGLLGAEV